MSTIMQTTSSIAGATVILEFDSSDACARPAARWRENRIPPDDGYAVALSVNARWRPVLCVWINQGGWPRGREGDHTVALGPATGHPDILHVAVARGTATTIGPGEEHTWDVSLCFGHATSAPSLLHANNPRDGRRIEGEGEGDQ